MKSKSFLAISFLLIIGIISITPYALAETYKIKNSNPRAVDDFGNPLTSAKVNQQVQITSDMTNLQNIDQPFTFAVKIFKEGIMVSDSWITGLLAPGQSLNPAQSWAPTSSGTYNVQIFVLESIDNPVQLAQPLSTTIVVEGTLITIPMGASDPNAAFHYSPWELSIKVNDKVTWYNGDTATHTVTSGDMKGEGPDGLFDSSLLGPRETFSYKFNTKGTYQYFCMVHAWMTGIVNVGGNAVIDRVPSLVMTPTNLLIDATTATGAKVEYSVKAIDNVDGVITPQCNPFSGSFFKIGETEVHCSAEDSAGNSASKSFTVRVIPPSVIIPDWIKNVASFWCNNEIEDSSFLDAIQYLINNKVIIVPETTLGLGSDQQVPAWVKSNACWWSSGQISNSDFASGIQYLISVGIIRV